MEGNSVRFRVDKNVVLSSKNGHLAFSIQSPKGIRRNKTCREDNAEICKHVMRTLVHIKLNCSSDKLSNARVELDRRFFNSGCFYVFGSPLKHQRETIKATVKKF